jgi:hypothetical protein
MLQSGKGKIALRAPGSYATIWTPWRLWILWIVWCLISSTSSRHGFSFVLQSRNSQVFRVHGIWRGLNFRRKKIAKNKTALTLVFTLKLILYSCFADLYFTQMLFADVYFAQMLFVDLYFVQMFFAISICTEISFANLPLSLSLVW